MRSSSRPFVAAIAAALVLLSIGAGPAAADATQPCTSTANVAVHLPDGTVQSVAAAALCDEADVFATQYFTRSPHQKTAQPTPYIQQGTSIRALLQGLQPAVDPDAVRFVAIPDDVSGTWSTLSSADLAAANDFTDGLLPVLQVNGDLIDYYRPLRSAQDANAGDAAQSAAGGGTLEIDVHTGPMLSVSASSDRTALQRHQEVGFTASVQEPPASSRPLTYSWLFGDGSTGTGAHVSHAFAAAGTYLARVTVSGADDSGGISNQVQETVAVPRSRRPGGHHPGSGSKPRQQSPTSGPVASHGHRTGAAPARQGSAGNATTGTGVTNHSGGGLTAPPVHDGTQTAGPSGQSPDLAANQAPVIYGQLIGDGAVLSAQQVQAATTAASAPAATAGTADRTNIWVGVGAATAVVALLLLGAVRERRRPRADSGRQVPR